MCLPAAALPLVAAGAQAAGTLVSGYSALQQGKYEAGVHRQNARMASEAAKDSITRGKDEARQFWKEAGQLKGRQVAAMAANGIDVGWGTALQIQQDTAAALSDDAGKLYRNIEQRTRGFDIEFSNEMGAASAAKSRGKQAMIGSVFGAASSLLGGAVQARKMRAATDPGSYGG